jgi:DNA polymerase III epsilon subunit-like protein
MILSNTLVDIGILPKIENLKLETVANFFEIPAQGEFHNALTDVKATFEIYKCLKRFISKSVINTLTKDALNATIQMGAQ